MSTNKYCKGCYTLSYVYLYGPKLECTYVRYNKDGQCPCTKCIVKMICQQGCPEYDTYKRRFNSRLEALNLRLNGGVNRD